MIILMFLAALFLSPSFCLSQRNTDTAVHLDSLTRVEFSRNVQQFGVVPVKDNPNSYISVRGTRGHSNSRIQSLQEAARRLAFIEDDVTVPTDTLQPKRDTTLMRLYTIGGSTFIGHIETRDSNRLEIRLTDGQTLVMPISEINSLSRFYQGYYPTTPKPKTSIITGEPLTGLSNERFESYFAPTFLGGVTLPSNGATKGFSGSAMALFGFRIPSLLYNYVGEFVGISYDSRTFGGPGNSDSWNARYISITPGLSMMGILSLGVTIGLPISGSYTSYAALPIFGNTVSVNTSSINTLIEPRVILGVPLSRTNNGMWLLLADVGLPVESTFTNIVGTENSPYMVQVSSVKMAHISIGLSYAFPLLARRFVIENLR